MKQIETDKRAYAAALDAIEPMVQLGMRLSLDTERNPESKRLDTIKIVIHLPEDFPDKYRKSIIRATDQCAVKKVIDDPPEFSVVTE